jgi:hypothetical protein
MLQANVLRVGCSLVEHWLFDSSWLIPDVSTACQSFGWFRKSIGRMGRGGWSTLLSPEETGIRAVRLVLVVFRSPLSLSRHGWWGGFRRAGRSCRHTASESLVFPWLFWGGVGVVWWWCGLVSVRVLRTA